MLARELPRLDLLDEAARSVSVDEKIQIALDTEKSALDFDARITNSEGAEFSNQFGRVIYASSHGFAGEYAGLDISVTPSRRWRSRTVRCSATIGIRRIANSPSWNRPKASAKKAAQRVLRRLGASKIKTCEVPIVFDPDMAASLMRNLSSAHHPAMPCTKALRF